jgi:hypothetical protein
MRRAVWNWPVLSALASAARSPEPDTGDGKSDTMFVCFQSLNSIQPNVVCGVHPGNELSRKPKYANGSFGRGHRMTPETRASPAQRRSHQWSEKASKSSE